MARAATVKWTREHTLIALNLYGKLPFGKLDSRNPIIREVAEKLGRTSSSLAMKLNNLASLDPVLEARGIKGLSGASRKDREMWAEFHGNLNLLAPESESLLHDLFTDDEEQEIDFLNADRVRLEVLPKSALRGNTEKLALRKERRGQQYFRQTTLNAYGTCCCISGITIPRLLVASHIRPWGKFPESRLDPRNGLCLSSLHDAAFDGGLITLDCDLCVILSPRLKAHFPQKSLDLNFKAFEGAKIRTPLILAEPDRDFLAYHMEHVFKKN